MNLISLYKSTFCGDIDFAEVVILDNLIIYGSPGSGKTSRLSDIYADLLERDGTPDNIACVAFNVSVADSIDERIASITGISYRYLRTEKWVATFHGLCRRLLSTEYDIKVLPPKKVAKEFLEFAKSSHNITITGYEEKILELVIQLYENYNVGQEKDNFWKYLSEYLKYYCPRQKHWSLDDVRRLYQQIEFEKSYKQFYYYRKQQTPIPLTFSELISETLQDINKFRSRFSYILVDEAQDLSPRMWAIIRQMNATKILVGDPDQSIYGFRYVSPNLFLSLPYKRQEMGQTYRYDTSYSRMLDNGLSSLLRGRERRNIIGYGSKIRIYNYIPKNIEEGVMLARTNEILRRYSANLTSKLVPHRLEEFSFFGSGTKNPLKRKFRKILVFLESNNDKEFTENIGKIIRPGGYDKLSFEEKMRLLRKEYGDYYSLFNHIKDKNLQDKIRFCLRSKKLKKQAKMLKRLNDPEQFISDLNEPRVTLSTVHRYKGRENANVFIPDFKDGLFPLKKGNFEEEVRIANVALSRVKKNLYLEGSSPFRRRFLTKED